MNGVQLAAGLVLCGALALCGCVHRAEQKAPEALMAIPVNCITQVEFQPGRCEATASPDYAICKDMIVRYECVKYQSAKAPEAAR